MFTRLRFSALANDIDGLTRAINDYFLSLERKGALEISEAKISATNGIIFPSGTLSDYKESTWTPSDGSGAGLSFTVTEAKYTKIGRMVHASCVLAFPVTASGAAAVIAGLPFASTSYAIAPMMDTAGGANVVCGYVVPTGTTIALKILQSTANVINSGMSGQSIYMNLTYFAS